MTRNKAEIPQDGFGNSPLGRKLGGFLEFLSRRGWLPSWIWYHGGHFAHWVTWHIELFGSEFLLTYDHCEPEGDVNG